MVKCTVTGEVDTIVNKNAIFTIAAKNYLASAITLRQSVIESTTNTDFYIILADELDGISIDNDINIVEANKLGISNFEEMAFRYDIVEFSTSIKPFSFDYLFNKGYFKVLYLDPDTYLFSSPDYLFKELDEYSLLLTPHVVDYKLGLHDVHLYDDFLKCGVYNLGFAGIKSDETGKTVIEWWKQKLYKYCLFNKMYFVDQKWMDLAPAIFENVKILKDRSLNIAWWNFAERKLLSREGGLYVLDCDVEKEVILFHFSNFKPGYPYDYYESRGIKVDDSQKQILNQLYKDYEKKLIDNGYNTYSIMKYAYSTYDNCDKIFLTHRRMYDYVSETNNPFSSNGNIYLALKQSKLLEKGAGTKSTADEKKEILVFEKRHPNIDRVLCLVLRTFERIVGIEKYEKLIRYIAKYYSLEDQSFLLKELNK